MGGGHYMSATFLSCDIQTGQVREELPLEIEGSLMRVLMTPTSANFKLPIPDMKGRDWEGLIGPWRTQIVVIDDDGVIIWSGIPSGQIRNATSNVITIPMMTPEAYLDRRYVKPRRFTQKDQCSVIAKTLASDCLPYGLPMDFDTAPCGVLRDREYHDDDAATVLKRLQELAEVIAGPEWGIFTEWTNDNQTAIRRIFRTGYPHIGVVKDHPMAVFELPGGLTDATYEQRWGFDEAGTHVTAFGAGEGEDRPRSSPQIATGFEDAGYPRLEQRTVYDSVSNVSVLDEHARRRLVRVGGGTEVFTLTQRAAVPPLLKKHWGLGDSARLLCDTDSLKIDTVIRIIGWEITPDMNVIKPILATTEERTADG